MGRKPRGIRDYDARALDLPTPTDIDILGAGGHVVGWGIEAAAALTRARQRPRSMHFPTSRFERDGNVGWSFGRTPLIVG